MITLIEDHGLFRDTVEPVTGALCKKIQVSTLRRNDVPKSIVLAAGMTATARIDLRPR